MSLKISTSYARGPAWFQDFMEKTGIMPSITFPSKKSTATPVNGAFESVEGVTHDELQNATAIYTIPWVLMDFPIGEIRTWNYLEQKCYENPTPENREILIRSAQQMLVSQSLCTSKDGKNIRDVLRYLFKVDTAPEEGIFSPRTTEDGIHAVSETETRLRDLFGIA